MTDKPHIKPTHIDCTLVDYHARKEWSHSQFQSCITQDGPELQFDWALLKGRFIDDPPTFPPKRSEAFDDGTIAHACLTSPGGIDKMVAVIPPEVLNKDGHRKGSAWKEWEAEHEGKIPRSEREMAGIRQMVRNVWAHPYGHWLMEHALHYEFSLIYECPASGLACRARPDLLVAYCGRVLLVDFKTTKCYLPRQWTWDMERYGYHRQFAWYKEAVELFGYTVADCIAVTVDKSPANLCRIYQLPERAVRLGQEQNHEHRRELIRRLKANDWTDPLGQDLLTIDLPARAYTDSGSPLLLKVGGQTLVV